MMGLSAKKISTICWHLLVSVIKLFNSGFITLQKHRVDILLKSSACTILADEFLFTGQEPTDAYLEAMIGEAAGPINFTMFLTMFGEKLNGKFYLN